MISISSPNGTIVYATFSRIENGEICNYKGLIPGDSLFRKLPKKEKEIVMEKSKDFIDKLDDHEKKKIRLFA